MSSSLIKTALQSSILAALSNVIAQLIRSYRTGKVLSRNSVDFIPVIQFAIYASISSPLNHQWQLFLESLLPGQSQQPPKAVGRGIASGKGGGGEGINPFSDPGGSFRVRNTVLKFILDQTVGAALNTIAFSASMALFRGANWAEVVHSVRRDFWPLMSAGLTVWPLFSLFCYVYVRSVPMRMLLGSLARMAWAIYITLATAVI